MYTDPTPTLLADSACSAGRRVGPRVVLVAAVPQRHPHRAVALEPAAERELPHALAAPHALHRLHVAPRVPERRRPMSGTAECIGAQLTPALRLHSYMRLTACLAAQTVPTTHALWFMLTCKPLALQSNPTDRERSPEMHATVVLTAVQPAAQLTHSSGLRPPDP